MPSLKLHRSVSDGRQEAITRSPSSPSVSLSKKRQSANRSSQRSSLTKPESVNGILPRDGPVRSGFKLGGTGRSPRPPPSMSSNNSELEDISRRLVDLTHRDDNQGPSNDSQATLRGPATLASPSPVAGSVARFLQNHDNSSRPSSFARCKIVIGIDFGTTFSGVAYAVVHPNDGTEDVRINTVCDWAGRLPGRTTSNKVPTEIAFDENDGGKAYWGFDIPDHLSRTKIKYVKLLLEPDVAQRVSSISDIVNPEGTKALLERQGRSAIKVAGLFVKFLWEHAKAQIIRHKGRAAWEYSEKVVLFTVPAVWSERAKHNTYMVAVKAGLVSDSISLHMVSEPEAAAVAVLKDRAMAGRLIEGEIFVVVDAGGGTVDLTSYRIVCVEPLRLEEVVSGDGDVCGATFLEVRFNQLLRRRVGNVQLQRLSPLIMERMMCDWEDSIRATFTGEDIEYHLITPGVPDDELNGIESGLMTLSAEDLRPVFSPTIERVQQLVRDQLTGLAQRHSRPAAIVLVGGLGSNRYLAKQLIQEHQSGDQEYGASIEIQQPDIAWESVAHGAVRCEVLGYGSIVSMRIARWNIGYSSMKFWGDGTGFHPEQKWYSPYDGTPLAKNCVVWLLRRGQRLEQSVLFDDQMHSNHWESEIEEALQRRDKYLYQGFKFIASQEDDASGNASAHTRTFMSITVKLDLSRFPPSLMAQRRSPDGRLYGTALWRMCATQDMAGMKVKIRVFDELVEDDVKIDFYSLPERIDEGEAYTLETY